MDLSDIGGCDAWGVELGEGDDFDQGVAGAVEVDECGGGVLILRASGVLLELELLNANDEGLAVLQAVRGIEENGAIFRKWMVVLCNLVARRLVVIEVVLPVEAGLGLDLAIQCYGRAQSWYQRGVLEDGLAAGEREIKLSSTRVGLEAGICQSVCRWSALLVDGVWLDVPEKSFRAVLSCACISMPTVNSQPGTMSTFVEASCSPPSRRVCRAALLVSLSSFLSGTTS